MTRQATYAVTRAAKALAPERANPIVTPASAKTTRVAHKRENIADVTEKGEAMPVAFTPPGRCPSSSSSCSRAEVCR